MREGILQRYRQLRAIGMRHHAGALGYLAPSAVLENARRLGLASGGTLIFDEEADMAMVFDLALYTAKDGRSRAIDRYAKSLSPAADSDAALMLDAMCRARFSIWRIQRRHEATGFVVIDVLRMVKSLPVGPGDEPAKPETWLVDEAFEQFASPGLGFAARLCEPESFAMTSGVVVPVFADLIAEIPPEAWRYDERLADPRLATAIYRAWLAYRSLDFEDDLNAGPPDVAYERAL